MDDETGELTVSIGSYQARTDIQYRELFSGSGLSDIQCVPDLGEPDHGDQEDLVVHIADRG